jgi:hypothetical protein
MKVVAGSLAMGNILKGLLQFVFVLGHVRKPTGMVCAHSTSPLGKEDTVVSLAMPAFTD